MQRGYMSTLQEEEEEEEGEGEGLSGIDWSIS